MDRKEVRQARAGVARAVSALMSDPNFCRDVMNYEVRDQENEIPIIVAASEESAAVALHRVQRTKMPRILLATSYDESVLICKLTIENPSDGGDTVDLVGGMTVRDWFDLMFASPGTGYTAEGSDFMASSTASEYAMS